MSVDLVLDVKVGGNVEPYRYSDSRLVTLNSLSQDMVVCYWKVVSVNSVRETEKKKGRRSDDKSCTSILTLR